MQQAVYSIQYSGVFSPAEFQWLIAICGGEECQLWVEQWAGFIKPEEAWIHLSDRPQTSLLIAPSSDAASSSNWQKVGVDGIKMAAVLFTSMTAACQLHGRLSEHGRERQREWEGEREALGWRGAELDTQRALFSVFAITAFNKTWNSCIIALPIPVEPIWHQLMKQLMTITANY